MRDELRLFKCHPTVQMIYTLDRARQVFAQNADHVIESGTPLAGRGAKFWRRASDDCIRKRVRLMKCIRIDGEELA